jgi:hypothetical protein
MGREQGTCRAIRPRLSARQRETRKERGREYREPDGIRHTSPFQGLIQGGEGKGHVGSDDHGAPLGLAPVNDREQELVPSLGTVDGARPEVRSKAVASLIEDEERVTAHGLEVSVVGDCSCAPWTGLRRQLSTRPRSAPPRRGGRARRAQARLSSSVRIGSVRMRLPVSAKIALQRAGATGGTPGSPRPPGAAPESRMCVSTTGISLIRIIG